MMPNALSRRDNYHPGKGTTYHNELNVAQALPEFGKLSPDPQSEDLRALSSPSKIISSKAYDKTPSPKVFETSY